MNIGSFAKAHGCAESLQQRFNDFELLINACGADFKQIALLCGALGAQFKQASESERGTFAPDTLGEALTAHIRGRLAALDGDALAQALKECEQAYQRETNKGGQLDGNPTTEETADACELAFPFFGEKFYPNAYRAAVLNRFHVKRIKDQGVACYSGCGYEFSQAALESNMERLLEAAKVPAQSTVVDRMAKSIVRACAIEEPLDPDGWILCGNCMIQPLLKRDMTVEQAQTIAEWTEGDHCFDLAGLNDAFITLYGWRPLFTVRPHTPAVIEVNPLSCDFDPAKRSAAIEKALQAFADDDPRALAALTEILGAALTRENFRLGFFFVGEGKAGKSTCLKLLSALCGSEHTARVRLSDIGKEHSTADLRGARINISDEIAQERIKGNDDAVLKDVIAAGTPRTRRLYENAAKTQIFCRFYCGANNLVPMGKELSERFIVFPFKHRFEAGGNVADLFKPESLTALLNILILGLLRVRAHLVLNRPPFSVTREMIDLQSSLYSPAPSFESYLLHYNGGANGDEAIRNACSFFTVDANQQECGDWDRERERKSLKALYADYEVWRVANKISESERIGKQSFLRTIQLWARGHGLDLDIRKDLNPKTKSPCLIWHDQADHIDTILSGGGFSDLEAAQ